MSTSETVSHDRLHIGVLGGGALGLSAAYRAAQAGHHVTVIERENVVGGLASSFPVGGAYLEKFYHHLFRSDTTITALIQELGLGDRLVWKKARTSSLIDGHFHQMDPLGLLTFSAIPPVDRLRFILGMLFLKLYPNYHRFEKQTAADWVRTWMGKPVYEVVWRPLLESKFGAYAEKIAMPWLWSRVFCRSLSLGYLRGGFHQLYVALAERVRALGGEVRLGETVERIEATPDNRVRVIVDGKAEEFDRVICTLPTRLFTRLAPDLPDSYRRQYEWGNYHGAHCLVLSLDRPLTDIYWISVHDRDFPFLVAVEHTNYMPAADYGGQRLIYLGNYLPMSDRRFSMSKDELLDWYLPYLERINPGFDRSWIRDSWVFQAPYAQPIVTVDYHQHIPPHETPIPGVYLANMFQVYPQDRGQNYSIAMAYRVVDQAIGEAIRQKVGAE